MSAFVDGKWKYSNLKKKTQTLRLEEQFAVAWNVHIIETNRIFQSSKPRFLGFRISRKIPFTSDQDHFFSGDSNLISTFTGILAGFHVRVPGCSSLNGGTCVANIYIYRRCLKWNYTESMTWLWETLLFSFFVFFCRISTILQNFEKKHWFQAFRVGVTCGSCSFGFQIRPILEVVDLDTIDVGKLKESQDPGCRWKAGKRLRFMNVHRNFQ